MNAESEQAKAMAAMAAYATPGEHHQRLERLVGDWTVKARMWPGPGAPPMESSATAEIRWMLGKRYVLESFTGEMGGQPVYGSCQTGFDNAKKKYVAVWTDTMSTGMIISEGAPDASLDGFSTSGPMYQAMVGQYTQVRFVTTFRPDGTHLVEMYVATPQGDFKMMESVYKRKS